MTMDVSQHSMRRNTLDLSLSSHASTCLGGSQDGCPPPVKHVYTTVPTQDVPLRYLCEAASDLECSEKDLASPSSDKQNIEQQQGTTSRMSALMIMRRGSMNASVSTAASGSEENLKMHSDFPDISSGSLDFSARWKKSSLTPRDKILKQTKKKSWSNLSGYDSCGPTFSRRERNSRNQDWISSSLSTKSNPDRTNDYLQSLFADRGNFSRLRHQIQPRHVSSNEESALEQYAQYVRRNKRNFVNTTELEILHRHICGKNSPTDNDPIVSEDVVSLPDPATLLSSRSAVENKTSVMDARTPRKPKVSFSTVEVRHYERILGDNPGVSSGPPLSIGWNYYDDRTIQLSVDDYEYYQRPCHDESDMVLSRYERETILEALGYSEKEVAKAIRQNYKLKRNRRQTVNNLPVMGIEEVVETAKKSLSKILPGKKNRSSKKLLKEWMTGQCENIDETTSHTSAQSGVKSILKSSFSQQSLDSSKNDECS